MNRSGHRHAALQQGPREVTLAKRIDFVSCRNFVEQLNRFQDEARLCMEYADGDEPEEYTAQEMLELIQELRISEFLDVD